MAEQGSPGWAPAVGRRIAKNAAANAALLSPIAGKSAHALLYDDTMAASTLHAAAAAAKDKTKGKKAAGRLLLFAYVAAEALDDAEAASDAYAAARAAVDKLRMAVTNEDGDAASERAREAAAAALRAAGLEDEMRRRLKRARPGKFALVHQVLEYLYVGGWAALNDDCRVLCGNQNFTAGSSPLDRARTAASWPRNDLVNNCRVHPTHWLISTQVACSVSRRLVECVPW